MKALVFLGPGTMEYRDEPTPQPEADEVIVKVEACGICGSDMHGWHGLDARRVPPLIMGHEASGSIVTGRRRGERVAINPLVACMTCAACLGGMPQLCQRKEHISMPGRPGAFAEFVRVPERNAVAIPETMDFATGALAEPVAVSYHAVELGARLLPRPLSALRVLVIGAGAIGLTAALILRSRNAKQVLIAARSATRRGVAVAAGLDGVFDPSCDGPEAGAVDLVIDAVGAQSTREMASRVVRPGGAIVHLGLLPGNNGLDVRRLTLREIAFVGSFCYSWLDFQETIELLSDGRLGPLSWIDHRPMAAGADAFIDLDRGTLAAAKIILNN
jgi:L-iditol 2-dehydrogenase